MECVKIKELLSEYIDQTLDFNTTKIIKEHLSSCKICSEELSALENCIRNVSSLKQVQAPEDFLQRVYERIERRFEFERIMRKLFVPPKVKIPLEFAGVLATVVLVIMVYRVIQPVGPTQPTPLIPEKMLEESKQVQISLFKGITSPETSPVLGPTQGLYMNKGMAIIEGMAPLRNALNIANRLPANAAGQVSFWGDNSRVQSLSIVSRNITPYSLENALKSSYPLYKGGEYNKEFSKIKDIIESLKGTIVFVQFKKEANLLESVNARIPSQNYAALLEKLKEIGISEESRVSIITKDEESIGVRIKLTPSK